jgi:hypothetical protein
MSLVHDANDEALEMIEQRGSVGDQIYHWFITLRRENAHSARITEENEKRSK